WTERGGWELDLNEVAAALYEKNREAGGKTKEFNTVTISDGITQGNARMEASLVSREFIFSSRRRHARFNCDWSSDVCSSDLNLRRRPLTFGLIVACVVVFLLMHV